MKGRRLVLVLSALLAILILVVPALGSEEQDWFVIEYADAVATRTVSEAFTSPVPLDTRFITEYAKTMDVREMVPVPEEMPRDLDPRFIFQYVKTRAVREMEPVPEEMPSDLGPRFILQYAKGYRTISMAYPCEIVGEPDDPIISELQVTDLRTDQATVSWLTNEYTDGLLEYGLAPGTYSWTAYEAEWGNAHSFILADLTRGTEYYYRVSSTDRCANTATSDEYSFTTLGIDLYLPLILRDY